jgi:hypothetical protein
MPKDLLALARLQAAAEAARPGGICDKQADARAAANQQGPAAKLQAA